jgi:hypothetical protein
MGGWSLRWNGLIKAYLVVDDEDVDVDECSLSGVYLISGSQLKLRVILRYKR